MLIIDSLTQQRGHFILPQIQYIYIYIKKKTFDLITKTFVSKYIQ